MNSLVKNAFLVLMGAVVATLLYFIFFGTTDLAGNSSMQVNEGSHVMTFAREWKGALFYMAEAVQTPTAKYYYDYCFNPSIHSTDYLDMSLGCTAQGQTSGGSIDLNQTDASLETEFISLPTSSYSTGWK